MKRMILLAAMICTISHGANVTSSYTKAEMDAVDATVIAQSNTWNTVTAKATQSALEATNTALQAQFTAQGVTNATQVSTNSAFQVLFTAQGVSNAAVQVQIATNVIDIATNALDIASLEATNIVHYVSSIVGTNGGMILFTGSVVTIVEP